MVIDIAQLILNIIFTIVIIYLTVVTVKFTAKPKLKVRFVDFPTLLEGSSEDVQKLYDAVSSARAKFTKEKEVRAGEETTLTFYVENVGHWYAAKPAARKVVIYVNFPAEFEPLELRFGYPME